MAKQGPQVVHDSAVGTVADIVFVHGLRGDAIDTWSKDGVCWPRDLLPQDLPYTRIITWGYDSTVANIKSFTSHNSIFGHAQNLLSDIARIRRDRHLINRTLVFVAHSLGGLVVKEVEQPHRISLEPAKDADSDQKALIRSAEYLHNNQNEGLGAIYKCTKGIVFLGTPHRGSDKAGLGQLVSGIAKLAFRQPNPHLLGTLEQDSDVLEHQRNSFGSISSKLLLVCIYEEEPTSTGMIVPQASAVTDGFNVSVTSIPADHIAMCKYRDTHDIGYARTADHIRTLVETANEDKRARDKLICRSEDRILDTLSFPEIKQRFEDIQEAYKKTFQWIFEDVSHGFIDWLRCGEGIFWISGKAGSGKSTLMKHIVDHDCTNEYLSEYAKTSKPCVAPFFFHDRGTQVQKSTHGLLRTVLLQILRQNRSLIPFAFPEQWAALMADASSKEYDAFSPTIDALLAAFKRLVQQTLHEVIICLFIDGLDEYEGRDEEIIEIVKSIVSSFQRQRVRIKACISSRPYRTYEHAFRNCKQLKVQDLTKYDIANYTADTLRSYDDEDLMDRDNEMTNSLIPQIVDKASGVFLWVRLVTESLGEGLRDGDTLPELQFKLAELPPTLEGLYARMLQKITPAHRTQAAKLFLIMLGALQPLDLLTFAFAEQGFDEAMKSQVCHMTVSQYNAACQNMLKRLRSRCVGLIEVTRNEKPDPEPAYSSIDTIQFLHQTVKELLNSKEDLVNFASQAETNFDAHIALMAAEVRKIKTLKDISSVTRFDAIANCVTYSKRADPRTSKAQVALLEELDRVMIIHQSKILLLSESGRHWSGYYVTNFHLIGEQPPSAHLNFYSFAVMHDLYLYIKEKKRQGALHATGKALLFFALPDDFVSIFEHKEFRKPRCVTSTKLLELLLQDYPDVNLPFDGESPWQLALRAYIVYARDQLVISKNGSLETWDERRLYWRNGLLEMLLLFASHGADPNVLVEIQSEKWPEASEAKSPIQRQSRSSGRTSQSSEFAFDIPAPPPRSPSLPIIVVGDAHSYWGHLQELPRSEVSTSLYLTPLDIFTGAFSSNDDPRVARIISILESRRGVRGNGIDNVDSVDSSPKEILSAEAKAPSRRSGRPRKRSRKS